MVPAGSPGGLAGVCGPFSRLLWQSRSQWVGVCCGCSTPPCSGCAGDVTRSRSTRARARAAPGDGWTMGGRTTGDSAGRIIDEKHGQCRVHKWRRNKARISPASHLGPAAAGVNGWTLEHARGVCMGSTTGSLVPPGREGLDVNVCRCTPSGGWTCRPGAVCAVRLGVSRAND